MSHRIIPRSEWGARHRPGPYTRPLGNLEVWAHHTVTVAPDLVPPFSDDYAAIRAVEAITEQRFGWGMAYTLLFTPAGLIFEGHPIESVGTHTAGHNRTGAAFAFVGNYDRDRPPQPMLDAAAWALREGVSRGWWKKPRFTGGHRDTKATACPGRHIYTALPAINTAATRPQNGALIMADLEKILAAIDQIPGRVRGLTLTLTEAQQNAIRTGRTTWRLDDLLTTLTHRIGFTFLRTASIQAEVEGLREAVLSVGEASGMDRAQVQTIVTDTIEQARVRFEATEE